MTLTDEENQKWKQIDNEILELELKTLMKGEKDREIIPLSSTPDLSERTFSSVEKEFKELALELFQKLFLISSKTSYLLPNIIFHTIQRMTHPAGYTILLHHQYADYLCPVHQLLQEYIPLHQFLQTCEAMTCLTRVPVLPPLISPSITEVSDKFLNIVL